MKTKYEPNEPMISQRELERKYNAMVNHESNNGVVSENRINCYTCNCGNKFKTIDMAKGVTPFMMDCKQCVGMGKSSFYNDIYPEIKPTVIFYRPSLKECMKLRRKPNLLEHILNGGLYYKSI